jgi:BirA family biotin operon repressor/biotin-[acetyl-CoA-carboxylase] ligase
MTCGCAVAKTLTKYQVDAKIKWPNDVLISGKKICGILTEMRTQEGNIQYIILGIGINLNFELGELPEDIREQSTTLRIETGKDISQMKFLQELFKEMDRLYEMIKSGNFKVILNTWRELNDTLGRQVKIITQTEEIEGIAEDVDESGALLVRTDGKKIKKIIAGDCIHMTSSGS